MFSICFFYFRLQALEAFIHTQRQLLERQRSDIDKLHRLRVDLCARPAQVLANLSNEVSFFLCFGFPFSPVCCILFFVYPSHFFSRLFTALFYYYLSPIHERTKERTANF